MTKTLPGGTRIALTDAVHRTNSLGVASASEGSTDHAAARANRRATGDQRRSPAARPGHYPTCRAAPALIMIRRRGHHEAADRSKDRVTPPNRGACAGGSWRGEAKTPSQRGSQPEWCRQETRGRGRQGARAGPAALGDRLLFWPRWARRGPSGPSRGGPHGCPDDWLG
jgi:hypothetical protein